MTPLAYFASKRIMITLYLYPELFGLPDNNPYGLKVDTFLRLTGLEYQVEHTVDTSKAPRGQLPYLTDGDEVVSDSNRMIEYLIQTYKLTIDQDLSAENENTAHLVKRMLDGHLYWVMSYSRWQDDRYWPLFRDAFLESFSTMTAEELEKPREYNIERFKAQGIGRYEPEAIYRAGIEDLAALAGLLGDKKFIFGDKPHTLDACIYGFLANIYYLEIETPLKQFIQAAPQLVTYCEGIKSYFFK